jgi:cytosol alanyl aminopeptidase
VLGNRAEDPEFVTHAKELAKAWLSDHHSVDPDLAAAVLVVSAIFGDRTFYDQLLAQAKKETDEHFQNMLLVAIGSFRDPAIARTALSLLLSDQFDSRQLDAILFAARPETRDLVYNFVKQNWDALIAKLPNDFVGFLPFVAGDFCDAKHQADAEAFFKERVAQTIGGPRNLQQVLERISLCVANKDANVPSVIQFLKSY